MIFNKNSSIKLITALVTAITLGCQKRPEAPGFSLEEDTKKVKAILKRIDTHIGDTSIYAADVVHMAQGSRAITNKAQLYKVLAAEAAYGHSDMTHELVTIHAYQEMVLTRGRVKGSWHAGDGRKSFPFETNNIITFRRMKDGSLKVWQVIFNRVELEKY